MIFSINLVLTELASGWKNCPIHSSIASGFSFTNISRGYVWSSRSRGLSFYPIPATIEALSLRLGLRTAVTRFRPDMMVNRSTITQMALWFQSLAYNLGTDFEFCTKNSFKVVVLTLKDNENWNPNQCPFECQSSIMSNAVWWPSPHIGGHAMCYQH